MQDLSGKKLLIVSGDGNDLAFVRAAKEMGLYVVCCDGHEDWKYSPAKEAADEAWNINYAWTEAVSYTHLDVYKRQMRAWRLRRGARKC